MPKLPIGLQNLSPGWEIKTLGEITINSQYGLNFMGGKGELFPVLKMGDMDRGRVSTKNADEGLFNPDEVSGYFLEKGDLLINRTNSLELVGKSAVFSEENRVLFASYLLRFKIDNSTASSYFVNYYLNSHQGRYCLRSLATAGVSQANINPSKLKKKLLIPLPPLPEQKEISKILTIWDNTIELMMNLIQSKVKLKSGLIQKLLTNESYNHIPLGDLLKPIVREVSKPQEIYTAIGLRCHGKGTFQKPDTDPNNNSMDKLYTVKSGDLIVNITFAWEGAIAIVKGEDDGCYVSHRFPTYLIDKSKCNPEYIEQLIHTKRFIFNLGLISPGGAGRNRVMSKKGFLKMKVYMPPYSEQHRIATILTTADREIELLQKKLNLLKLQKKGLMQQLLTGKIRVKVDEPAPEEVLP